MPTQQPKLNKVAPDKKPAASPRASTPIAQTAASTGKPMDIPYGDIEPGHNARTFTPAALATLPELASSIAIHGLKNRITVYPHPTKKARYCIHGGERRYRAIGLLIKDKRWSGPVPCSVEKDATASQRETIGLIENLQRADLNPMDKALGIQHAIQTGGFDAWNETAPARSFGHILGYKSKSTIYALLNLCTLCTLAQQALRSGELSPSVADKLARIRDHKAQAEATQRAIADRWTDKETAEYIADDYQRQLKGAQFDPKDATLLPRKDGCGGACTDCPFRSGNQSEMFGEFSSPGRGDMCLNPKCYNLKIAAAYKIASKEVEKNGGEAKPPEWSANKYISTTYIGGGYHTLSSKPYQHGGDGKTTVAKLFAEELEAGTIKLTLIPFSDMTGWHECITEAAARKAFEKRHPQNQPVNGGKKASGTPARYYEPDMEQATEVWAEKLEKRITENLSTAVAKAAPILDAPAQFLIRAIAAEKIDRMSQADIEAICQAAELPKYDPDECTIGCFLQPRFDKIPMSLLVQFIARQLLRHTAFTDPAIIRDPEEELFIEYLCAAAGISEKELIANATKQVPTPKEILAELKAAAKGDK
jgi:ParB/RepB/Spo0J family partition protein